MSETDPRTHWLQFSLQTLFMLIGLCAVLLALTVVLGHEVVLGFSGFVLACGFVLIVMFALAPFAAIATKIPYPAAFIVVPALYCILELAFFLFGEAVDQPHPKYMQGNWFTHGLLFALPLLPFIAIGILIVVAFDAAVQTTRPRDPAYFPLSSNLHTVVSRFETRLLLVIGVTLVFGYYAFTVVDVWHNEQLPATVWPPKRVFLACNFLWGILWLTDCLVRPRHGTIAAVTGFFFLTTFLLPMGFGVLRE